MVVGENRVVPTPKMLLGNVSAKDFGSPETVVWWAAFEGANALMCDVLCDPTVDRNRGESHGATPLYVAVYRNHLDTVKILCDLGGSLDVNKPCTGNHGATPFWLACHRGHLDIVQYLAKVPGVDIHRPNDFGLTPYDAAEHMRHTLILAFLDQLSSHRSLPALHLVAADPSSSPRHS